MKKKLQIYRIKFSLTSSGSLVLLPKMFTSGYCVSSLLSWHLSLEINSHSSIIERQFSKVKSKRPTNYSTQWDNQHQENHAYSIIIIIIVKVCHINTSNKIETKWLHQYLNFVRESARKNCRLQNQKKKINPQICSFVIDPVIFLMIIYSSSLFRIFHFY